MVFAFPDPSLAANPGARFALGYVGDGAVQRQSAAVPDKGLWLDDWKGGRTIKNNGPAEGTAIYDVGTTSVPMPGGVPEPASWALMIMGFGGLGAALRKRQLATA